MTAGPFRRVLVGWDASADAAEALAAAASIAGGDGARLGRVAEAAARGSAIPVLLLGAP